MAKKNDRRKKGVNKVVRNIIIGVEALVLIAVIVVLIFLRDYNKIMCLQSSYIYQGREIYIIDPESVIWSPNR